MTMKINTTPNKDPQIYVLAGDYTKIKATKFNACTVVITIHN